MFNLTLADVLVLLSITTFVLMVIYPTFDRCMKLLYDWQDKFWDWLGTVTGYLKKEDYSKYYPNNDPHFFDKFDKKKVGTLPMKRLYTSRKATPRSEPIKHPQIITKNGR